MRWVKKIPPPLFLLPAFLLGFLIGGELSRPPRPPSVTPAPTPTDKVSIRTPAPEKWRTAVVTRVIDGDTVVLKNGEHIRYAGINAPENNERWGEEAGKLNTELTLGKTVKLEPAEEELDFYGRRLAYVWVGEILVNEKLLEEGYARRLTYRGEAKLKHCDRFVQAEQWARDHSRGVWLDAWLKR